MAIGLGSSAALVLTLHVSLHEPPPVLAADGPSLTIYSTADPASFDPQRFIAEQRAGHGNGAGWQVPGYGIVRQLRRATVGSGVSELRFDDVAELIDPTTVSCVDLTDPATTILEQRFEFDLANAEKLLDRYVGRDVTFLEHNAGAPFPTRIGAKLLSAAGGALVLDTTAGIRFTRELGDVQLPALPEGLITRPTLVWRLESNQPGEHELRTTYQTGGLTWRADYNLVLDASATHADLGAWVSLLNLAGSSFKEAQLKLIAGDVNRVQPPRGGLDRASLAMEAGASAANGFEERSFFEYHLYSLPRRVDIPQNATQQITLFPTRQGLATEKVLVYCGLPDAAGWSFGGPATDRELGSGASKKVDVYVRFDNKKENQLGIPLPKGKVRVFQLDPVDGTLEFIGENLIDHTPKDEQVLLRIGESFDVVGDRVQTDFESNTKKRNVTESFRVTVKNHKPSEQKVVIRELLYRWTSFEIQANSDPFTKIDSKTIHFDVTVPAGGERVVTYTVKYSW